MSVYLHVRKWVDRKWSSYNTSKAVLGPAALVVLIGVLLRNVPFIFETSLVIALSWIGFTLWRAIRMGKAFSIKGDRHYDRKSKFDLHPDYHDTESATAASRRRRNG